MSVRPSRSLVRALMLVLLLAATGLRFWQLPEIPPGLWYDEAYNGMDALRLLDTRQPQIFFPGNNGREPLSIYLQALSVSILGTTPYALRIVAALAGILTIPLVYAWAARLHGERADRHWLGLIAATGFACSLWHVMMSRSGFRAILLPFFVLLAGYLFWRGWQLRSWWRWAGAGAALGLSQYTYLSARLLPLAFGVFGLGWFWLSRRQAASAFSGPTGRSYWIGWLVMGGAACLVFAPLALYFVENPITFSSRTNQVFILTVARGNPTVLLNQLADAARVFMDGREPNWRHGLVEQPVFTWLDTAAFWIGLLLIVRRLREPHNFLLLAALLVLWLPAPLSVPAFHSLRLSALLPVYYVVAASGLLASVSWVAGRWRRSAPGRWLGLATFAVYLAVSGGLTGTNYFVRWAGRPEVYDLYNGSLVDTVHRVLAESRQADVLLSFNAYAKPAAQFLLHDYFRESAAPPPADPARPAVLVGMPQSVPGDTVWLRGSQAGPGSPYLGRLGLINPASGERVPVYGPSGDRIGDQVQLGLFYVAPGEDDPRRPQVPLRARLGDAIQLLGYSILPTSDPLAVLRVQLHWQAEGRPDGDYTAFVQLLDSRGQWVAGQDAQPLGGQYPTSRWQNGEIVADAFDLALPAGLAPGDYRVVTGMYEAASGRRLPASGADGQALPDDVIVLLQRQLPDGR